MDNKGIKYVVICIIVITTIAIGFLIYHIIKGTDRLDDNKFELSEITYTAPEGFEEDIGYNSMYYDYKDDFVYCDIRIRSYDKETYDDDFKDAKEMLKNTTYAYLSETVGEVEEVVIGNKTGYRVMITSPKETNYYYGVESTKYIYKIEYEIRDYKNGDRPDLETNKCYTSLDKFIESVQVK